MHVAMLEIPRGAGSSFRWMGVEGPRIDGLIGPDGSPFLVGNSNSGVSGGLIQVPILFSDDGGVTARTHGQIRR